MSQGKLLYAQSGGVTAVINATACAVIETARAAKVPMGRLAVPDEIARSIYWLGSELNTFTCNQIISVSGGE